MGQTDHEPDPNRRIPTVLWLMLGIVVVALFVLGIIAVGHHTPKAVGPSAGGPRPLEAGHP